MSRKVAVVGAGQTKCGRRNDVTYVELIHEAVKAAFEDANLSIKDVDVVVEGTMPAPMEGTYAPHLWHVEGAAAQNKPLIRVATCGSTGMSIAHCGYYLVASGLYDIALVIGSEKMYEGVGLTSQAVMSTVADAIYERPFIGGAPPAFALQCIRYIHERNFPLEKAAEWAAMVSVRNHEAALDNPYAHIKMKITVDDVLKSRIISYPVRLLDVCPISDGACAVIFASEEKAKKITDTPAWIKGVGYCGDDSMFADKSLVEWQSCILAVRKAYWRAGIENPLKQIDVAELYNPFTYQELLYYELFGFCGRGEAGKLVEEGIIAKDGEIAVDPSGGVLCTNPIGASGLQRVAECAHQIMGKAGKRQVSNVNIALAHAMGGSIQFNGIMILSRDKP